MNLSLPDIVPMVLPKPRTLSIKRQKPPRNDFGFSLRRAMVLERGSGDIGVSMRAVIFAEPGTNVQNDNETGLLPGDKLLEVNAIPVEDRTREDIIDLIKASGDSVTLKVRRNAIFTNFNYILDNIKSQCSCISRFKVRR